MIEQRKLSSIISLLKQSFIDYKITHYNYGIDDPKEQNIHWNIACISSKDVRPEDFFIGLQGEARNGGEFVQEALSRGARVVMIEKRYEQCIIHSELSHKCSVIIVKNTLSTLSMIASSIRESLSSQCTFIGITGSAGKTTTKHIIYHLLRSYKETRCSQGNLNTVQGMALCMLNTAWESVRFAVFECGISQAGEMSALVDILNPDYAVITNVGNAHIGGYENRAVLIDEKLSIAKHISKDKILWIPDNDETLKNRAIEKLSCEIRLHGTAKKDGYLSYSDKGIEGIVLRFYNPNEARDENIAVPLLGEVNVYNALLGLQVAMYFGVSFNACKTSFEHIQGIDGRYQVLRTAPLIINDSYNASPEAVQYAVQWFAHIQNYPMKIVVLGGMKELGTDARALHTALINNIINNPVHHIICYGEEFEDIPIPENISGNKIIKIKHKADIVPLLETLTKNIPSEEIAILLKGSRFYALETIAEQYNMECLYRPQRNTQKDT